MRISPNRQHDDNDILLRVEEIPANPLGPIHTEPKGTRAISPSNLGRACTIIQCLRRACAPIQASRKSLQHY